MFRMSHMVVIKESVLNPKKHPKSTTNYMKINPSQHHPCNFCSGFPGEPTKNPNAYLSRWKGRPCHIQRHRQRGFKVKKSRLGFTNVRTVASRDGRTRRMTSHGSPRQRKTHMRCSKQFANRFETFHGMHALHAH